MSTSLLYHAFGIQGTPYVRTRYEGGAESFAISRETTGLRCPERNLKKRFGRPSLKKRRQIAIDEISIGKGHRYLT